MEQAFLATAVQFIIANKKALQIFDKVAKVPCINGDPLHKFKLHII